MREMIVYSAMLPYFLGLYQKAEKENHAKAQFELAKLYSLNEKYYEKTVALLRKSAKHGYTDAYFALGICYENGYGVKKSYLKAISWYCNAENNIVKDLLNNPDPVGDAAIAKISRYYQDAEYAAAVDKAVKYMDEFEEDSFEYDQRNALSGNACAQNKLGHRYYYGHDVEKDFQKSIYWYQKSAEQGYEAGMFHLAECYKEKKDFKESAMWYRKYAKSRINWRNARLGW